MDINEIKAKYNAGGYTVKVDIPAKVSLDHVFDEELSVKRNRELAQEHNDKVDQLRKEKQETQAEFDKQFTHDIVEYLMDGYTLSEVQARKVESFVFQEYHSSMCDYFSYIDIIANFADDLINLSN